MEGVQADSTKIESMINWLEPKHVKSLSGFQGLTKYYKKFVKNYNKIATLYKFTKERRIKMEKRGYTCIH